MTNRKKLLITGVLLGTLAMCCACGKTEQKTADAEDAQNTDTKQEQIVPEEKKDTGSAELPEQTTDNSDAEAKQESESDDSSKTAAKTETKPAVSAKSSDADSKENTAAVTTTNGKTAVVVSDAAMTDCFTIAGSSVSPASDSTAKTGNIVLLLGESNGKARVMMLYGDNSNRYGYISKSALSTDADTIRKTSDHATVSNADCYEVPEEEVSFTYTGLVTVGDDYQENWCPVICVNAENQDYVYVKDSDLSYSFDAAVPDITE